MALRVVARGHEVSVAVFTHRPGEPPGAREWWPRPCLAFTEYGAWSVRAGHGGGDVDPGVLLVGAGGAEYDCDHPYGADDRSVAVILPDGAELPRTALVPVTGRIAALRRDLRRAVRTGAGGPDLDALAWSLAAAAGVPAAAAPSPYARECARRVRALLDGCYRDPDLDLAAVAASLELDRTRMIHMFREVSGVTPHRYLLERRVTYAAARLATTGVPVGEVCFESGFGSMARFHEAFRRAFGTSPSAYRARH